MGLREQLSGLNRQYKPLEITSADGEASVTVYYRRPSAAQDKAINSSFDDEYEAQKERLNASKDGHPSEYEQFHAIFLEEKPATSINALINWQSGDIYKAACAELEVEPPAPGGTKAEREAFAERIKPKYEEIVAKKREDLEAYPADVLARRAAEIKVHSIAQDRANDVLTRKAVAQSIFQQNESGEYELVWQNADEVSADLDSDTIASIVRKINAEVARSRTGPLT